MYRRFRLRVEIVRLRSVYVVVAPPPSVRSLLRVAMSLLHFSTLLGERLFSLKRRPRHPQPSDRSLPHVTSRSFCVAVKLSFSYMPMSDPRFCLLLLATRFMYVLVK